MVSLGLKLIKQHNVHKIDTETNHYIEFFGGCWKLHELLKPKPLYQRRYLKSMFPERILPLSTENSFWESIYLSYMPPYCFWMLLAHIQYHIGPQFQQPTHQIPNK